MAVAAIIAFSCENESVDAVYDGDEAGQLTYNDSKAFDRLVLGESETCCGSDNIPNFPGSSVSIADVGLYCPWGTIPFDFCDNNEPQIQFEGQFNSFVRGLNGWNIAYIDQDTDSDWCDIVAEINIGIQYEWNNPGTEPTCNGGPCNEMGIDDPDNDFGGAVYGVGYYTYDTTTTPRSIDIFRDLIVWKNCDLTGTWDPCEDEYEICTATKAYRLRINAITPNGPSMGQFSSTIDFEWECLEVISCTECNNN